ncbi:hypothetical protein FGO68_gene15751 [Halteria grandinella]|uniref:Peptidyl-prolyl cis-trans isomerase n=1 Tax=Halteria grandinella TaxID=5974 RepID=A0A8J8NNG7_HALGN|nr:hypothetical protein FGO68_gene15751 [Halteria grandinella]
MTELHFQTLLNHPKLQSTPIHSQVFFDITIDNKDAGRIIFNLYADTPKTSENFRALCTGEKGKNKDNKPLHYKGSKFFKVVNSHAEGGDITKGNGNGGESIYGPQFDDENFIHKHNRKGLLSMKNKGKNTNNSQFFITFSEMKHHNGKNVVFGQIADQASFDVLDKIQEQSQQTGTPKKNILIANSGELKLHTLQPISS